MYIFKFKNWRLAVLAIIFIVFFTSLGFWQLSRAKYKKRLLNSFAARTLNPALSANDLSAKKDYRFFKATLSGKFDNGHIFLLDNKTFHGKVGYEIYIPFKAAGLNAPILVDLGFIEMNRDRHILPRINPILEQMTITGMLNDPPTYVAFGPIKESKQNHSPLRIEFINLPEISKLANYPFFSYVFMLDPKDPHAFAIEWQVTMMGPEKHTGYAVQWFALAITLLLLLLVLNRGKE